MRRFWAAGYRNFRMAGTGRNFRLDCCYRPAAVGCQLFNSKAQKKPAYGSGLLQSEIQPQVGMTP